MRMLPVLFLVACGASSDTPCEKAWWLDEDGDGYGGRVETWIGCDAPPNYVDGPEDCDDADPTFHPGAAELCDALDNDCNGEVDDNPPAPPLVYEDLDFDGYGNPDGDTKWACPSSGWSDLPTDCDDTSGVTFPGAVETCDFRDRNCDGSPVLGATDGEPWYLDNDGDGFGRTANSTTGCGDPEPGFSLNNDDCNDTSDDVYPGAPEGVYDGFDADCDGLELCPFDADNDGYAGTDTILADLDCTVNGAVQIEGDCDDDDPAISPDATEVPYNGIDEDCDPITRDDDLDEDGYLASEECDDWDPQSNPTNDPPPVFADIAASVGLDEMHWDPATEPPVCPGSVEYMAGGAAIADYDGDGRYDIFLARMYEPDRLYRQLSDGTYEEVGAAAGVDWSGSSNGAIWFDAEGDGDQDLAVVMVGTDENRLYINDGTGTFTEEGILRGFALGPNVDCNRHWSISAGDADGDGDLDLHVTAWQFADFLGNDRARMLINDGNGFFTDETLTRGLDFNLRSTFTSAFVDTDGDGDRDLAVAADFLTSGLFENDGLGGFTDITVSAGVGTDENGMGADWGDIDGDGDLDWFITSVYDTFTIPCDENWGCTGNRLFINDGGNSFSDGTDAAGLRDGAWGWGTAMVDIDHDGDLDIAQQNGMPHDGFFFDVFRMFVNDGTGAFTDESCTRLTEFEGQGRAVVPFDHDNDGDLDLLLTFTAANPILLENQGGDTAGNWLRIGLNQLGANPDAVGSTIRVTPTGGGQTQIRLIHLNSTYVGVAPAEAHFGLGSEATVDVEITWPDGAVQLEAGVTTNQILSIGRSVP